MAFDDYEWKAQTGKIEDAPKPRIDKFLYIHKTIDKKNND